MTTYSYTLSDETGPAIGLVVLQADETIERDFRRLLPGDVRLLVSRVPSGTEVTTESLAEMEHHLAAAAGLFPRGFTFDAVGYACTSGAAQIGPARVAEQVRAGTTARAVTDPVSALVAACQRLGVGRIGILSPYLESVSARLRAELATHGIETPVFGSFAEPSEAKVARIDEGSVIKAGRALAGDGGIGALFLSCTNLRTLGAAQRLQADLGLPVLSSNLVLAWHLLELAGHSAGTPGDLLSRA